MKHKNDIPETSLPEALKALGKRNIYTVPDGYFDTLQKDILSKVSSIPVRKKGLLYTLTQNPYRAIAASILLLVFSGLTYALVTQIILPEIRENKLPSEKAENKAEKINSDSDISNAFVVTGDSTNTSGESTPPYASIDDLNPDIFTAQNKQSSTSSREKKPFTGLPGYSSGNNTDEPPNYAAQEKSAYTSKSVSFTTLNDTMVCKGQIVHYKVNTNKPNPLFTWSIDGKIIEQRSRGNELYVNTEYLTYGSHIVNVAITSRQHNEVVNNQNVTLKVIPKPSPIKGDLKICGYDQVVLSAGQRNPNFQYLWSTGARSTSIKVTKSGKYWVTIAAGKGEACSITDTFDVTVMPTPIVELGTSPSICLGDNVKLGIKNPSDQYTYKWYPTGETSPSIVFTPDEPGKNIIKVEVTACKIHKDQITINVIDCNIEIPNVITPNGDGINDYFVIKGINHYSKRHLIVNDRNGTVVYENSDYQNNWDGQQLQNGTYFYILTLSTPGGKSTERSGVVRILR